MHEAFDITEAERQDGLGAFKRLDLHLFVNAQHNRMIRRIEVEPDDVFDLECARVIRSKSSRSLPTTRRYTLLGSTNARYDPLPSMPGGS